MRAFTKWVNLLYWSLPSSWKVNTLINDIRTNNDFESVTNQIISNAVEDNKDVVLPDPSMLWTDSCQRRSRKSEGYTVRDDAIDYSSKPRTFTNYASLSKVIRPTLMLVLSLTFYFFLQCGLWSLFHIISIGVAEQHHAVIGDTDMVSTAYVAETIRDYINNFLGCAVCRKNFNELYKKSCGEEEDGVCDRFNRNKHTGKRVDPRRKPNYDYWQDFALWLWEIHNSINCKLRVIIWIQKVLETKDGRMNQVFKSQFEVSQLRFYFHWHGCKM